MSKVPFAGQILPTDYLLGVQTNIEAGKSVSGDDLLRMIDQWMRQSLPEEARVIIRQALIPAVKSRGRPTKFGAALDLSLERVDRLYRKPPKANQFRKGRTGNPRGKKRGEENLVSAFKRHVQKRVKINDGDQIRTITLAEAVIRKNYSAALHRNPFALSNMFRLAEASGEFIDRTDPKQVGRPLAVPVKMTVEEFLARHGQTTETDKY